MKKYNVKVNGNDYTVAINSVDDKIATVEVNGTEFKVELENSVLTSKTPSIVQKRAEQSISAMPQVTAPTPAAAPRPSAGGGAGIKSPLPGTVLDVLVKEGDSVKAGQKVIILEAMKMENDILADKDGVVTKLAVSKGAAIMEGDLLITIE